MRERGWGRGADENTGSHGSRQSRLTPYDRGVKTRLDCPCGEHVEGTDEDDLVVKVQKHLADSHPGLQYGRDDILFLAY
jgi:hypothetical protein